MNGYAGTPLPRKLGVKPGLAITLLGAPEGFEKILGKLPEGVQVRRQARGASHIVMLFAKNRSDLDRRISVAKRCLAEGGGLWIAWRKQSSGVSTDLTQSAVRATGLASGLVDHKICSIDATWSGLRFVRRKKSS